MEKDIPGKCTKEQVYVAILIPNKTDVNPKLIRRDREEDCILIKRKVFQEDIEILNVYAPNTRAPKFIYIKNYYSLNHTLTPHTDSGKLQYPTASKRQVIQPKAKQRNSEAN